VEEHLKATLEAAPLDQETREALRQFFLKSSAYVVGKEAVGPEHEELAHRWREQLVLEQTVGAIRAGRDDEALALALQDTPLQRAINCRRDGTVGC
jgi:hypothetical protein